MKIDVTIEVNRTSQAHIREKWIKACRFEKEGVRYCVRFDCDVSDTAIHEFLTTKFIGAK